LQLKKFIIGIRQHPFFGYIAVPLIVGDCNTEFCVIRRTVVYQDIIDSPNRYNELEKRIVSITDKYSDQKIYQFFNKNKKISVTEYLSSLDQEFITKYIRPYIDKYIFKLITLLKSCEVEIYYKPYRYEYIYHYDKISINKTPAEAIFNFERTEEGIKYYLTVSFNEKEISIYQKKPIILVDIPAYVELEHILMYFEEIDSKKLLPFYTQQYVLIPKRAEMMYFENFILKTVRDFHVKSKGFEIKHIIPEKKAVLYIEKDWTEQFIIVPVFSYNNIEFKHNDPLSSFVIFDKQTFCITKYSRDFAWEKELISFLENLELQQYEKSYIISYKSKIKELQQCSTINWINENYHKIIEKGFIIEQKFASKKYFLKNVNINFEIENKIDWFDVNAIVHFGDFEFPFIKLKDYILNDIREFELPNKEIAIIPEAWFSKYKNILKLGKKTVKNTIQVYKIHFQALTYIDSFVSKVFDISVLNDFFTNPTGNLVELPKNLKSKLRDYQKVGYSWLMKLNQFGFGGCLADDMGLGKTVQVLTALLKNIENQTNKSTSIIIVPRSLLHNWLNEVYKHTPTIKTLLYAGNEREKLQNEYSKYDLLITSYGVARNDLDFFQKITFDYIVLDESQYIKNPLSKTYLAIKTFIGKNKIVLTGTPIENSLKDLWSQLHFSNKGLLGSFNFFKDTYISRIEKFNEEDTKNELKKLIAPYILRRTKEEVIKDLPEIEEQVVICEMTEEQTTYYEEEKAKIRNKILEFYNNGTLRKSSVYVLQALTKLRQISNHPYLVDNQYDANSGKFDEIFNRLETLIIHNHKVLIFSSFVKYLKLFEKEFLKRKWKYEIMTGLSTNRQEIINKFQENDKIQLFLISIKAGGVGINLTAADYVFILDPWWNPAVEKQAIARAHRIGQTKNVFAFKFITFGTIEEKISILQAKKSELSQEFIDLNNYFNYFTDENIVNLFE
jgi:SNF2 family DNA or RNA helicase